MSKRIGNCPLCKKLGIMNLEGILGLSTIMESKKAGAGKLKGT
jgi:hypothetical protein